MRVDLIKEGGFSPRLSCPSYPSGQLQYHQCTARAGSVGSTHADNAKELCP